MIFRRRKQRWDPQPTEAVGVIVASDGRQPMSGKALEVAAVLAEQRGCQITVVTIAKVHGTQFGIPHPGLMPTKKELITCTEWVEQAVASLKRRGLEADGQVSTTRHGMKSLANIAQVRHASTVVIDGTAARGLRRLIEGDPAAELRRRLSKHNIDVEIIPADT